MGANSKKREMRRYELKKLLIWVNSTSYKELKEKFDVCDKVIVGDLEYIEDVEGITLERKPGVEKLDSVIIEYVLESVGNNTTKVRNIKNYLLTVLFNAPTTCNNYYVTEVNHDLYGKS